MVAFKHQKSGSHFSFRQAARIKKKQEERNRSGGIYKTLNPSLQTKSTLTRRRYKSYARAENSSESLNTSANAAGTATIPATSLATESEVGKSSSNDIVQSYTKITARLHSEKQPPILLPVVNKK